MSATIATLIQTLGEAIQQELSSAEVRAKAAEADAESFRQLRTALAGYLLPQPVASVPANDEGRVEAVAHPRTSVSDDHLLSVMDEEWMTAGQIQTAISGKGLKIAEGTVYNRMRKLAMARPDTIEATKKPERWRLRGGHEKPEKQEKSVRRSCKVESIATTVFHPPAVQHSNDNPAKVYAPTLWHGDCLDLMPQIPDESVDLILADLPYGVSRHHIDVRIDMERLWAEYRRLIKPTGNIVLFAQQPFTTTLINAAPDLFAYSLVWSKSHTTGFPHAASKPLRQHEDILVFTRGTNISAKRSSRRSTYNPQNVVEVPRTGKPKRALRYLNSDISGRHEGDEYLALTNCPRSILHFPKRRSSGREIVHPYAKPLDLLQYLIRTYSNEGETVLDNAMGGGSTLIAAMNTGRYSIGVEKDQKWFKAAASRCLTQITEIRKRSSNKHKSCA